MSRRAQFTPYLLVALALLGACADDPLAPAPLFKPGNAPATPLTAAPTQLGFTLPPGIPATLTARVQYVGAIAAQSSNTGCATVTPASVPATKPAGSSQYVATFTVTPVGLGSCTITLTDKKGQTVVVPVSVEGAVSGGRIVFNSSRDGNEEIYIMGANGPVRLTNNTARDRYPVLSPDGTKIAFYSDRDGTGAVWVMDADGTDALKLTSGRGDIKPAFSPDGNRIVYASFRLDAEAELPGLSTDLWIMNADGSNQTLLLDDELGVSDPAFSPDGTRIVFTKGWQIWIMNADGSDPVQLTTQESNSNPSFSPDGTKIVFASDVNGSASGAFMNVWVMNADGSLPVRLTHDFQGADNPTFSPDGARIVFGTTRNGNADIYQINADGSSEVRLTSHQAADVTPRFGN